MISAAVIDCFDRGRFFERFNEDCGVNVSYMLSEHSYLLSRSSRKRAQASSLVRFLSFARASKGDYSRSLDYFINGSLKARLAYAKGLSDGLALFAASSVDIVFIWNGCQSYARGVAEACRRQGVPTCYLEIGNFPGKIFVDREGVNAESHLYSYLCTSKITEYCSAKFDSGQTAEEIVAKIKNRVTPPQKNVVRFSPSLLDRLRSDPFSSVISLVSGRASTETIDSFDGKEWHQDLPGSYIFVALQVSVDTQMLLNSDVNSEAMLKDLQRRYGDQQLVVKFHPCDSVESINRVKTLISKFSNVSINQGATISLIEKAQKVITINSTVGLEAILLGKEVEFYGRSLFSKLSQEDAVFYINNCLINIDYFSNEPITVDQIDEIKACL